MRSNKMLPSIATSNAIGLFTGDAVLRGNLVGWPCVAPNRENVRIGQFRPVMFDALTLARSSSSFGVTIGGVGNIVAIEEMGRVAARRVVACVADVVFRIRSISKTVGDTVGLFDLATRHRELAVSTSLLIDTEQPRPARIGATGPIHLRPEPVLNSAHNFGDASLFAAIKTIVANAFDAVRFSIREDAGRKGIAGQGAITTLAMDEFAKRRHVGSPVSRPLYQYGALMSALQRLVR